MDARTPPRRRSMPLGTLLIVVFIIALEFALCAQATRFNRMQRAMKAEAIRKLLTPPRNVVQSNLRTRGGIPTTGPQNSQP
jgi:hypothetical protein